MIMIHTFIFTVTGAFMIWAFKGFKGRLDDEMVSIEQRNSAKGLVRFFIGFVVWMTIGLILVVVL